MNVISQTNRTILFEQVNPEKLNLTTLIGDVKGIDSLNDDKLSEIRNHLLVKNFDEFLNKFQPKVYSFYNAVSQKVMYTLEKPDGISAESISEIILDQNNDFLKMLFTLIDTKKSQGIKNVDFKFENILEMISPKKVMEDIKQVRKEVNYLYEKYEELDDEDPQKLEIGDRLNIKFEEASQNYNNVMGMLPLAIEDIKTRLLLGQSQEGSESEAIEVGILTMGDNGELKILEAPKPEEQALVIQSEEKHRNLIAAFEEDYEEVTENSSAYVKDLVLRTFAPLPTVKDKIDIDTEVLNYNTYLEFYKNSKDDFIKTAKPLVEKILGIKMFFEQYETKNNNMAPSLLITNDKLDMTIQSNVKNRFITYLNTVNAKNDFSETIWFGIVPAIELDASVKTTSTRMRFKGTNNVKKQKGNTIESLAALLDIVKDYKVQIFFNFQGTEETTFNNMATMGIDKYINKCSMLARQKYSEFAIPCLPNFTVIPKDKSGVILDSKMENTDNGVVMSKQKEDVLKLWLEGVYVDAAYVASGLVSAYQCPDFLKEKFRNVSKKYPGVRFDIEGGDNNLKVTTTLAKEISGFTNTVKEAINRNNFGFVFSSENAQIDGEVIKRITVYKARNLSMNEDGYDSIYKTLVSTYIERILRFQTSDFKQDKIARFFSTNPSSQKSAWMNEAEFVNSIIQNGDDISHNIDTENNVCNLELMFNGNVKNLEVSITKSSTTN